MKYALDQNLPATIFRTYDIRGIVGKELTPNSVYTIGRSIGSEAIDRGQKKIIIGRDGRLSGPELLAALSQGLQDSGCDVINLGEVTTPILYYATNTLDTKSGVMLTGSHNPPDYNGIKMVIDGVTICEDAITELYKRILNNRLHSGHGTEQKEEIIDKYINNILQNVKLAKPLKVVIDCGNGVGGKVAPAIFKGLGCEVIELFCEVDGTFPNHHPDPLIAENLNDLIHAVKEHHADIGLAFDGDADRLGLVSDLGEIIWPDRQLILIIRDILKKHAGAKIPFDVKCTKYLATEISKAGGIPVMTRTGHALLKAKIKELNSPLGGELSGHIVFGDWPGLDDGIYSGVQMLRLIATDGRTTHEIFADIPNSVNTPELKMDMADELKYQFMERFLQQAKTEFPNAKVTTVDGIRVDFEDGFGLVRPSNTTPTIIFRFEGFTKEALERIKEEFRQQLLRCDSTLKLPF